MAERFELLFTKLIAGVVASLANFPSMLLTLLAMMTLDYISGLSAAGSKGEIDARKARKGIWGKITILAAGVAGYVMSSSIPAVTLPNGTVVHTDLGAFVCGAFAVAEFISILKNVRRAGGKLPKRLDTLLAKLEDE